MIFCLGERAERPYKTRAMTRKQIEISVVIFTILLVFTFCFALYKVGVQVGLIDG